MDIVNEYMKNNRRTDWIGVKRLECNDGFSMSVQAHDGAYCIPRVDPDSTDYYFNVEIGFPSEKEDLIMEYVEDYDRPTDTVYGYVPVEIVAQVIEKHGGIKDVEYLRSVSTDINIEEGSYADRGISIGDRVEVLEDNSDDSDTFYEQGEVGIVVRMLEESCVVDFSESSFGTAKIPFSSLKKVVE